jgi:SAM-dependent methyltransferase
MLFWRKDSRAKAQHRLIALAENLAAAGEDRQALSLLRQLPVEIFANLLLELPSTAPALRALLPSMASDDAQRHWTGASGKALMSQSLDFMRAVDAASREHLGRGISGKVLDYGCGWGRLLRLLLWYVEPDQIYGADPWDQSLDMCRQHNCPGHLAFCDYVPNSLPFTERFDLIYAFSVFTHLSEKTADAVLRVLRSHINTKGMLVITIRPPEYWKAHSAWRAGYSVESMLQQHAQHGFAFVPHALDAVDGDITYGDTSMTLDFLRRRWPEWKTVGTACNANDPLQILVFMLPV